MITSIFNHNVRPIISSVATNCIVFTGATSGDAAFNSIQLLGGANMKISNDGRTFVDWDGSEFTVTDGKVYVRGKSDATSVCGFTGNFTTVSGPLMSLVDYDNMVQTPNVNQFYNETLDTGLFTGSTLLTDASGLTLSSNGYSNNYCYKYMFNGCTSLTSVPHINGISLTEGCFYGMFASCTALTSAPTLPDVTTVPAYAYFGMFQECEGLTSASNLSSVTTLGESAMDCMFAYIADLTGPVYLPQTPYVDGTTDLACKDMFTDSGTNHLVATASDISTCTLSTTGTQSDWEDSFAGAGFDVFSWGFDFATLVYSGTHCTVEAEVESTSIASGTRLSSVASVIMTATAASSEYEFTSWSDGSTDNPRTFTMGSTARTLVCTFSEKTQYTITLAADCPSTMATPTLSGGGVKYVGESFMINASAASTGYRFSNWTDSSGAVISTTVTSGWLEVTGNETYTAHYVASYITFTGPSSSFTSLLYMTGTASKLYCSTDGSTWSNWGSGGANPENGVIYVCGQLGTDSLACIQGGFTKVSGDLRCLIDYTDDDPIVNANQFYLDSGGWGYYGLFGSSLSSNTTLADVTGLIIPELSGTSTDAYSRMFSNCTALNGPVYVPSSPYLKGTTTSACSGMFTGSGTVHPVSSTTPESLCYIIPSAVDSAWSSSTAGIDSTYWKVQSSACLTFTGYSSSFTSISVAAGADIQYSDDNITWTTAASGASSHTVTNGKVFVRAVTGSTALYGISGNFTKVEGDILSLVDYANISTASLNESQFYGSSTGLFKNVVTLVDASGLTLPSTTTSHCYRNMFSGCSSLTETPSLPAKSLTTYCYYTMFQNCTSLTDAPALPATTLNQYCYAGMFAGCTALTDPPTLSVTSLVNYCYYMMFSGSGLTSGPTLPATSLAGGCYYAMFMNCTSLVTPPTFSSLTSIGASSCRQMFYGCSALATAPNMSSVTTIGNNGCQSMFSYSDKASAPCFTTGPNLASVTSNGVSGCEKMFLHCTNLTGPFYTLNCAAYTTTTADMFTGAGTIHPVETAVTPSDCYLIAPSSIATWKSNAGVDATYWEVKSSASDPSDNSVPYSSVSDVSPDPEPEL